MPLIRGKDLAYPWFSAIMHWGKTKRQKPFTEVKFNVRYFQPMTLIYDLPY